MNTQPLAGWATIIVMAGALVVSIATAFGVVIPENEQAAITSGIIAIIGIILRLRTNTSAFKKTSPAPMPAPPSDALKGPGA